MNQITPEKINQLLAFLPAFEQPDRDFLAGWRGLHPQYAADVTAFFNLASDAVWMDYQYQPAEAGKLVADDAFIAQADLPAIKTMLTYCVRGERFSTGFWGELLANGRIQAILRRLQTLITEPHDSAPN
ncbi:MAG: hypothetical protein H6658_00265 [Ardenticatenaceae bacterium]|nr:hypothetical protein [Ardenticatenaceae bacterium]